MIQAAVQQTPPERFARERIRASALELAEKTKEKKRLRREALAQWRATRPPYGLLTAYDFANIDPEAHYREFLTQHAKALQRGRCARFWGLCRGFAEGWVYARMEPRCHVGNEPSPYELAWLLIDCLTEPVPPGPARELAVQSLVAELKVWLTRE